MNTFFHLVCCHFGDFGYKGGSYRLGCRCQYGGAIRGKPYRGIEFPRFKERKKASQVFLFRVSPLCGGTLPGFRKTSSPQGCLQGNPDSSGGLDNFPLIHSPGRRLCGGKPGVEGHENMPRDGNKGGSDSCSLEERSVENRKVGTISRPGSKHLTRELQTIHLGGTGGCGRDRPPRAEHIT